VANLFFSEGVFGTPPHLANFSYSSLSLEKSKGVTAMFIVFFLMCV